jgi:ketosteroid isomerase-like protein
MLTIILAAAAVTSATPRAVLVQLPADLAQAVRDFDDAQIGGDGPALNRLLADDFVLVNSRAELEDKRQMVADYTAPGFRLARYTVERPIVRQWRDGMVISGEVTLQGRSEGKPFKGRIRFTDVWRHKSGKWQVAFTAVTPLK